MQGSELIVGVDIGTATTCVVVAESFPERDAVDVVGVGTMASGGVAKGVVEDPAAAGAALREALKTAEAIADVDAQTGVVSLAGEHLASQVEIGMVDMPGSRPITSAHLESLRQQGHEITLPAGREVVHVDAGDYTLDSRRGLASPEGMVGSHLEAQLNIVTGSTVARARVEETMERARIGVHQFALEGLATAVACLSSEERQLGVILIGIGAGVTSVSHFRHGALSFHSVLPLGGETVTRDIATCLETDLIEAERLKLMYSQPEIRSDPLCELQFRVGNGDELDSVTSELLGRIISARTDEILELARDRLMMRGSLAAAPCGIVIAGGGSQVPGVVEAARRICGGMPSKLGEPRRVGNGMEHVRDPATHAALGLALLAADWAQAEVSRIESMPLLARLWEQVKALFGIGAQKAAESPDTADETHEAGPEQ